MDFPVENPWVQIEAKAVSRFVEYGYRRGFYTVDPSWNRGDMPSKSFAGLDYEIMHAPSQKTKRTTDLIIEISGGDADGDHYFFTEEEIDLNSFAPQFVWTRTGYKKPNITYPANEIMVRLHEATLVRARWLRNNLRVGDFVKCKGTRSGDWNQIDHIDLKRNIIFGPKYRAPGEGMRYESSENSITKIARLFRDGVEVDLKKV